MKNILLIFVFLNIIIILGLKYFVDSITWNHIKNFCLSEKMKDYYKIIFWSYILYLFLKQIKSEISIPASWINIFLNGIFFIVYWEYLRKKIKKMRKNNTLKDVFKLLVVSVIGTIGFYEFLPEIIKPINRYFIKDLTFPPSLDILIGIFILGLFFAMMCESYKEFYDSWKKS